MAVDRRNRRLHASTTLAVVVGFAGCGGEPRNASRESDQAFITVDDLGSGWTSSGLSDVGGEAMLLECEASAAAVSATSEEFTNELQERGVGQLIGSFDTEDDAEAWLEVFGVAAFDCFPGTSAAEHDVVTALGDAGDKAVLLTFDRSDLGQAASAHRFGSNVVVLTVTAPTAEEASETLGHSQEALAARAG